MTTFGSEFSDRTTFVTGAYGMLGFWIVKALLDSGGRVVVLKRDDVRGSALALEGLEGRCDVVRGSITDLPAMDRVIGEYEVDTVFHLAAQTIVGVANRSPVPTFETNILGTWNIMEAVRRHGVERTVVAASDKSYGHHDTLPYQEHFALQARHPYDVSKACTDLIARSYWHTYEVPVAVTRFANIYGGGDLNRSRLVPELVDAVLDGRAPVIRSDGSPERDFLYAEDAANAYLAIAGALDSGEGRGEAFNAGGDKPHSVREMVELLISVAGSDVKADYRGDGVPAGEIDRQFVDSTKLREMTGWAPEVGLEEGLRRTVQWYSERPESRQR